MPNYVKSRATALKMLTKFGQDVTRTIRTKGTYDPALGKNTVTETTETRKGALLTFGRGEQYFNGSLIEIKDKRLLLDGEGDLNQEDTITVSGTEYRIISIDELNPAGTRVFFDLQVRA